MPSARLSWRAISLFGRTFDARIGTGAERRERALNVEFVEPYPVVSDDQFCRTADALDFERDGAGLTVPDGIIEQALKPLPQQGFVGGDGDLLDAQADDHAGATGLLAKLLGKRRQDR